MTQSQVLEEKVQELADCNDQLEVAREAEEEYERRLDDEQAKGRRKLHALEVKLRDVNRVMGAIVGSESGPAYSPPSIGFDASVFPR